jgi:hypothetical protein
MKKIYLSVCIAILTTSVFAQIQKEKNNVTNTNLNKFYSQSQNQALSLAKAPPFFTDDFSNPSDWTMTDIANGGAQNWVIGTNGPIGTYSGNMNAIVSTSGGNFALYDSDALNTAYSPQDAIITYNFPIDCSAYPYVNINFESYHKMFHDSVFVEVSTDNVSWDRYRVHTDQTVNDISVNPEYVSVNISASAGNQPVVYFRFHYEGEWDYAWMIDDVSFTETPNNKLTISDETYGGWWIGYQIAGGMGLDYTFNPMNQVTANPYHFEAVLKNQGINTQDSRLHVHITDDLGTSVFRDSSSNISLAMASQDTLEVANSFLPQNMGIYYMDLWGVGDSAITDTTLMASIVTDTIYGRDWGQEDGYWRVGRSCGGMVLGVDFDMYVTDDLTSVSAFIADISVANAKMFGALYEVDPQGDPMWLAQTDDYTIQVTDLGNWVTIPFNGMQTLTAGTAYMIAIGGYAHPIDTFAISTSGVGQGATCHIQDNGCNLGSGVFGDWYWISSVPMIRMNMGMPWSTTDIIKTAFDGKLSVYPNPTKTQITIDLSNTTSDEYAFTISNVLGAEVCSYQVFVNGTFKKNVDLSSFPKGVYLLNISNSNSSVTERIVVE